MNGAEGLSDLGPPASVKPLLASPSALLLLGTLGAGLLAIVLYWLLIAAKARLTRRLRSGHRH